VIDPDDPRILPPHIAETIRAIAHVHRQHHEKATPAQRVMDRMTDTLGSARFAAGLTIALAAWAGGNVLAQVLGYAAIDPPPFPWLNMTASVASLYMVVLILATQRREGQLAQLREQLTLELAILGEQKTAKVIELLEEARRDNPLIHDRVDHEADAMARPADPQSVLDAIRESHAQAEQTAARAEIPAAG
jgi:uncharacterized membrane protein